MSHPAHRRVIISTAKAPIPGGQYSQGVLINSTLYLSGQVGRRADQPGLVKGGVAAEARQALVNLGEVLKAADAGYENVIKTTVLLADIKNFGAVNEVYKEFFPDNCPARAAYQVGALPIGAQVEIEAVAQVGRIENVNKL